MERWLLQIKPETFHNGKDRLATPKCPHSTPEVPPLPLVESGDGSDCSYAAALPTRDVTEPLSSLQSTVETCVCVFLSHLSGSVDAKLEAAAGHVKEESHQTVEHSCSREESRRVSVRTTWPDPVQTQPAQSLGSPVVEKIPPTMPHSRTRNCHSGMCCSLTVTISELVSYLTKIPETPWLPAAWLITRSWRVRGGSVSHRRSDTQGEETSGFISPAQSRRTGACLQISCMCWVWWGRLWWSTGTSGYLQQKGKNQRGSNSVLTMLSLVLLLSRLTVQGDLLCPVQRTDDARHLLPERQMVYSMGEVVHWKHKEQDSGSSLTSGLPSCDNR